MTFFGKDVPFSLGDLQSGINRMFDQVWHGGIKAGPFDGQDWAPPLDLIETNDRYIAEVELPGISLDDVEVSCTNTQLTIKGQKTHSSPEEEDNTLVAERRYGGFCRVIPFAEPVRADALSAKLDNGVLRVEAPKKTVTETQAVRVSVKEE